MPALLALRVLLLEDMRMNPTFLAVVQMNNFSGSGTACPAARTAISLARPGPTKRRDRRCSAALWLVFKVLFRDFEPSTLDGGMKSLSLVWEARKEESRGRQQHF
jgi:hypothetical protein